MLKIVKGRRMRRILSKDGEKNQGKAKVVREREEENLHGGVNSERIF